MTHEIDDPEIECPHENIDFLLCEACNGSGEGMTDQSICGSCNGSGESRRRYCLDCEEELDDAY